MKLISILICAMPLLAQYQAVPSSSYPALDAILNAKPAATSGAGGPSANCTAGKDLYLNTSSSPASMYYCDAANHWTALGLSSTAMQTNQSNTVTAGTQDFSAAAHTLPSKSGLAASKPATCTTGEEYFATDATAGQNKYYCTSTNTWTQQSGGGGSIPSTTAILKGNNAGGAAAATAGTDYQAPLGFTAENAANKGAASGYAPLNASATISNAYLPFASRLQSLSSAAPILAIYMMGLNCDGSPFAGGSGSTLKDCSGNGYDATLGTGGATPSVGTDGSLVFSGGQTVTLPAGVVGKVTGVYAIAHVNESSYGGLNTIIGSGASGAGFNLIWGNSGFATPEHSDAQNWLTFLNRNTNTAQVISGDKFDAQGLHSVAVSLQQGTVSGNYNNNSDLMFMDGRPAKEYFTSTVGAGQGFTGGSYFSQTDSPMVLGLCPGYTQYFHGSMYMVVLFSDVGAAVAHTGPTPAQMSSVEVIARNLTNSYGNVGPNTANYAQILPASITLSGNRLIACCDSITAGVAGMTPWPQNSTVTAGLTNSYTILNLAQSGWGTSDVSAAIPAIVSNLNLTSNKVNVAVVMLGTNDIQGCNASTTCARAAADLTLAKAQQIRSAGAKVVLVGAISRTGTGVDTTLGYFNSYLRTEWTCCADSFVDVAQDPAWQAGAYANPSALCGGSNCYLGDGTHPTTAGGLQLGNEIVAGVNRATLGRPSQRPLNPPITVSTSITEAMGDIQFSGSTASQTLTLFSPLTATGRELWVTNTASVAVTVSPVSGTIVYGGSAVASISLAANSTLYLRSLGAAWVAK